MKDTIYCREMTSPIGDIYLASCFEGLIFVGFKDGPKVKGQLSSVKKLFGSCVENSEHEYLLMAEAELKSYFKKELTKFSVPLKLLGSDFRKQCWQTLQKIPFGQTWSYRQEAEFMNRPTAFRAVANANGANLISIIVPCHRVVASNGGLGGYSSGLSRKKYLLNLEQTVKGKEN